MTDPKVVFDLPMLQRLKKAHADAVAAGDTQFVFEGREYVTAYAGYLIEYLVGILEKQK